MVFRKPAEHFSWVDVILSKIHRTKFHRGRFWKCPRILSGKAAPQPKFSFTSCKTIKPLKNYTCYQCAHFLNARLTSWKIVGRHLYPPYIDTANMAHPTWQPQYRTHNTAQPIPSHSITAKLLSAQWLYAQWKNTLKKFSQKKCGMNNHTTLDICAFHHVQLANQHMELSKEFKLAQLE